MIYIITDQIEASSHEVFMDEEALIKYLQESVIDLNPHEGQIIQFAEEAIAELWLDEIDTYHVIRTLKELDIQCTILVQLSSGEIDKVEE